MEFIVQPQLSFLFVCLRTFFPRLCIYIIYFPIFLNWFSFRNNTGFLLVLHRTWWQHHFLAVVGGFITTLILGLSAIGIWLVRRLRQQSIIPYEPVGAPIPEQELQPLQS